MIKIENSNSLLPVSVKCCSQFLDCKYSRSSFTPDYLVGSLVYPCANGSNFHTQVLFLPVTVKVTEKVDAPYSL